MNPTLSAPSCIIDKVTAVHRLNVLTLNVHKGFTFFNRRFILPELRDAVRATGADLVFLQEVHGSHQQHAISHPAWPQAPQYEFLADSMWPQFAYGRNAVYPHGDHGNALLSKFPIVRSENLDVSVAGNEQRGLLHCQLEVPGHDEVHAICVHLGLREAHRQKQVSLLFELLDRLPAKAPVIIAGDFNDWRLKADAVLSQRLIEAFGERFGSPARSFPARLPLLRLDRIYVRNAMPHAAKVLSNYPWSHLSDHAPLAAEINV
ncbi:endonuclease/exonuclease/phosphatase family protein [Pseudomonas sp. xss_4]|uniref:endonuclease/exonuclease/phosphatase family protein n=1 Tax=Pseudomonas TaxID=286 RepID=UPI0011A4F16F|nr:MULTISPECIES: endonuclease/exonuclease/phosphatase family protein [Pseudomonas]MBF8636523.1 endonuclease/exonuclease/phosphatase family protein [Pseudomonas fulva]MBF8689678.1 endonuclease/exonuclease/phosphatase family protein [Pseudomonas fulva]MBF8694671.1 endonuclease/exonuclease/phosphatase family protein [Pseudomonas fulva]MEB8056338.1 endonuclease/exonuclease/phosphatase family protein [Pseudomonas fulva]